MKGEWLFILTVNNGCMCKQFDIFLWPLGADGVGSLVLWDDRTNGTWITIVSGQTG